MKKILLSFTAVFVFTGNSWGASVTDCDEAGFGISSIVAGSEKTYYNGKVAVYSVDKEEPAASPAGVAINLPIKGEGGEPKYIACKSVSGLSDVEWDKKTSSYDAEKGILIEVPASQYNRKTRGFDPVRLKIRINLDNSSVTLE